MPTRPCYLHPFTPLFYSSKTGVLQWYTLFIIFALKHWLWALVITASVLEATLTCSHNKSFEQKNKKNITIFFSHPVLNILHMCVFFMPIPYVRRVRRLSRLFKRKREVYYANMPMQYAVILKAVKNDNFPYFCSKHRLRVHIGTASIAPSH